MEVDKTVDGSTAVPFMGVAPTSKEASPGNFLGYQELAYSLCNMVPPYVTDWLPLRANFAMFEHHLSIDTWPQLLAAQRDPESYIAGAAPLNQNTARYSSDIDIFHDRAERVATAALQDVTVQENAGHPVVLKSTIETKGSRLRPARLIGPHLLASPL